MNERITSSLGEQPQTPLTRRSRRQQAAAHLLPAPPTPGEYSMPPSSTQARPVRTLTALSMVCGLVATFALPAYGAGQPTDQDSPTLQQVASEDAQSLVVASGNGGAQLNRESYAATTPEEIERKKAAEAAAARARASGSVASIPFDPSMVSPSSGVVRWPLGGPFRVTDRFGARGGAHMGTDMVAAGGTPVYASLDGMVRISQDSYAAYGVTVVVDSVLNGQRVSTVYPHMQTGSRQVAAGQTVTAGQLVGLVGSTGRSTANHLHFEVYLDGTAVDSLAWLEANAG
ncbi:M23 family metallopeptidase [Microbacterium schleiferi]|uniref:M23 family metallopeptidase n=2 Tax=Microbacterium schleiferi TaxID=69362 RepID=A0A7S8N034_9MICO|nr:M23 family metallopeptidase [Microbacterium schleiferi]